MKTAIITRPIFDARIFAQQCHHAGIMPLISPMIDIVDLDISTPRINHHDGLIFTSANGVRQYEKFKRTNDDMKTIFAVGQRTRDEALSYGYQHIITANGDVDSLASEINSYYDKKTAILNHPAGVDVAGDLQSLLNNDNISYHRLICYKAQANSHINHYLRTYLKKHTDIYVCFFSKRTAMIFFRLLKQKQDDIFVRNHNIICLSQHIADYCADFPHHHIMTATSTEKMIEVILAH